MAIEMKCQECNDRFWVKPSRATIAKYCCDECRQIGAARTRVGKKYVGRINPSCEPGCTCKRHDPKKIEENVAIRRILGGYIHPDDCTCGVHTEKILYARRGKRTNEIPAIGYYLSKGYIVLTGQQEHPLGDKNGHLTKHRKVLFDAIGPGDHECHWCGKLVNWDTEDYNLKLHVDHLDEDKLNNNLDNLVPSCFVCNIKRGRK